MEEGLPIYMKDFEDCLHDHYGGKYYMVSKKMTFADIAILCLLRGYKGSQPDHYHFNESIPLLKALEKRLNEDERIMAFLESERTVGGCKDSFC